MAVSQRSDWYGEQQQLSPAWTLRKGSKAAKCAVWSHQFGWELRLIAGPELVQSQVCRSETELIETQEQWKAAMLEKGWQEQHLDCPMRRRPTIGVALDASLLRRALRLWGRGRYF